jgi:hypothetical protein
MDFDSIRLVAAMHFHIAKYNKENEKSRLMRQTRKITIALLGPNLDVLKSNLERLKSTTLSMLHVIMYAGQLRK